LSEEGTELFTTVETKGLVDHKVYNNVGWLSTGSKDEVVRKGDSAHSGRLEELRDIQVTELEMQYRLLSTPLTVLGREGCTALYRVHEYVCFGMVVVEVNIEKRRRGPAICDQWVLLH